MLNTGLKFYAIPSRPHMCDFEVKVKDLGKNMLKFFG